MVDSSSLYCKHVWNSRIGWILKISGYRAGFYGYVRKKFGYKISLQIRKITEKVKRCLLNNNCSMYNKIKIFENCDFFSFLKVKIFYKKYGNVL